MTPADTRAAPRRSRRLRTKLFLAALLLITMIALIGGFVWGAGRWLFVQDPLEKSRAIVVLSGRMPLRAREVAALYREGWAPEIWVMRPAGPAAELEAMGIPYVGEEFYSERVLLHFGVPPDAIRLLDPEITNTAGETAAIAKQLERSGGGCAIIVTTKAHTRRARTLWNRSAANGMRAVVRAARDDPFDPAHWWRTSSDALDVVREILGLANAWAGLPLQPVQ